MSCKPERVNKLKRFLKDPAITYSTSHQTISAQPLGVYNAMNLKVLENVAKQKKLKQFEKATEYRDMIYLIIGVFLGAYQFATFIFSHFNIL